MLEATLLPHVNATLNALASVLLVTGWILVRRRRLEAHRRVMLVALACSALFLVSYLTYHYQVGSVRFTGPEPVRTIYLAILLTHTVLAVVVAVMAPITVFRALKERFDRHRAIARWTLPIWLYVSVTGVVVYWMLYRADW